MRNPFWREQARQVSGGERGSMGWILPVMDGHSKKLGWMRISFPPVAGTTGGILTSAAASWSVKCSRKLLAKTRSTLSASIPGSPLQSPMRRSTPVAATAGHLRIQVESDPGRGWEVVE